MSSRRDAAARPGSAILLATLLASVVLTPTAASTALPVRPAAGTATVTLAMTSVITFRPAEFAVEPGQNITLTIVNEAIVLHSFTLFAEANVTAPLSAYSEMLDFNASHAKIVDVWLSPGESRVVNFTAPSAPGRYLYVCMYAGHWSTMNGRLLVGDVQAKGAWPLGLVPTIMVGTIVLVLGLAAGYQLRTMRAVRRAK